MTEGAEEGLSERAQLLLKALIENYIRDGQPVGSRTLSRDSGLSLSSATIRNVMADLEDLGFVASPHTSAGRVPTDKGYRFFVDTLLKLKPLHQEEIEDIERRLGSDAVNGRSLVQTVSQMLSSVTHMAGLVTLPNPNYVALSQIEFIALSENRVLAIMVMSNREIQNRVVQLDRFYSTEELRRAANYLNEAFSGRSLPDVRAQLLKQMQETRQHMDQLMRDAIQVAQKVFHGSSDEGVEYVIAGETNLMGFAELSNVERLKRLFEAFNEKHDILRLAGQLPARRRHPNLHRSGIGLPNFGRYQRGDGALYPRQPGRGGPGHYRPDPDGLRARHSDRRSDGETPRFGLERP